MGIVCILGSYFGFCIFNLCYVLRSLYELYGIFCPCTYYPLVLFWEFYRNDFSVNVDIFVFTCGFVKLSQTKSFVFAELVGK